MHTWDDDAVHLADEVVAYAVERLRFPKDPRWGAVSAEELAEALNGSITATGIGGDRALALVRDVVVPHCRPMDDPLNLAYVPTAPTPAATMIDLVVSASSIMACNWESGAGAIAAENQAIEWLAGLAGYPPGAGGVFVSGGSAANLSALVTARSVHRERHGRARHGGRPLAFAATREVHSSVRAAAHVMDVELVEVPVDERGAMTAVALRARLDEVSADVDVFAVVATGGTTNAGVIDDIDGLATECERLGLWLHVDGAYGLAALAAPTARHRFAGIERSDSFGVDPHKWLFAPYDCAALVYRDPGPAAVAHAQHGDYLAAVDRSLWNPSDYAYHLSRRARGLPLWFSLATHGTEAYERALEATLQVARRAAELVHGYAELDLVLEPDLGVVLFRRLGWQQADFDTWSRSRARSGTALVVPTMWNAEPVMRMCFVNPATTEEMVRAVLDDIAGTST